MLNVGALCLIIFKVVSGEEIIRLFITQQGVNFITAGNMRSDTLPLYTSLKEEKVFQNLLKQAFFDHISLIIWDWHNSNEDVFIPSIHFEISLSPSCENLDLGQPRIWLLLKV